MSGVAALYDIHGNLPALEAVLEEVVQAGVYQIVVGGDVVLGPIPVETLRRLEKLDIPEQFISGNADELAKVFAGIDAQVVVCGHTHMQFDRMVGDIRVVNAGSVGMPFGQAGADWLLLGPDIQLRHTSYDLNRAADRIRNTRYPQAEDFAANHVLKPPSEEKILAAYAGIELR